MPPDLPSTSSTADRVIAVFGRNAEETTWNSLVSVVVIILQQEAAAVVAVEGDRPSWMDKKTSWSAYWKVKEVMYIQLEFFSILKLVVYLQHVRQGELLWKLQWNAVKRDHK